MRGSPIIHLSMNSLPGPDHTSVELSHQVVRRPDDLGCVASKLTINNPTKILNHILLSDTCHSASAFLFVRKYKQGCKIQILTGYLLKRFCCRLTFTPLKFGICERTSSKIPFRTVEKSAANVLTSRDIFSQIVDFTFLIFRIDERTSKSENNIRARCVL